MLLKSKKKKSIKSKIKKNIILKLKIVKEALNILEKNKKIDLIGNLLDKYWKIKKNLSNNVADKKLIYCMKKELNLDFRRKIIRRRRWRFLCFFIVKQNHKNLKK